MISIASCRICSLDPDVRRDIDLCLIAKMSYAAIARKYATQISRNPAWREVSKHAHLGHVGKEPGGIPDVDPRTMTAQKEERHRKTVEDRIDDIYERCKKLSVEAEKKAETSRDFQAAANCLDPAIRALGLVAKETPKDDDAPGIDRAIAKMKERRDQGS